MLVSSLDIHSKNNFNDSVIASFDNGLCPPARNRRFQFGHVLVVALTQCLHLSWILRSQRQFLSYRLPIFRSSESTLAHNGIVQVEEVRPGFLLGTGELFEKVGDTVVEPFDRTRRHTMSSGDEAFVVRPLLPFAARRPHDKIGQRSKPIERAAAALWLTGCRSLSFRGPDVEIGRDNLWSILHWWSWGCGRRWLAFGFLRTAPSPPPGNCRICTPNLDRR
mmetsp:Transcript_20651/g.38853  ORF Transcript_20651/g.38853 Transcript_20651/m.38853 type:complete len:221 (+) Transcript_20651:147-809(+)